MTFIDRVIASLEGIARNTSDEFAQIAIEAEIAKIKHRQELGKGGAWVDLPLLQNLRDASVSAMARNNAWEWELLGEAAKEIGRLARENAALNKALDGEEERVSQAKDGVVRELRALIVVIDGLSLPDHYSMEDKHRDRCSRAGVRTEIERRIAGLEGKSEPGPASAAEQFVATTAALMSDAKACPKCKGTGAIDTPYSGSDPSCPDCGGSGQLND